MADYPHRYTGISWHGREVPKLTINRTCRRSGMAKCWDQRWLGHQLLKYPATSAPEA